MLIFIFSIKKYIQYMCSISSQNTAILIYIYILRSWKIIPPNASGLEELPDIDALAKSVKASHAAGNAKLPQEHLTTVAWMGLGVTGLGSVCK